MLFIATERQIHIIMKMIIFTVCAVNHAWPPNDTLTRRDQSVGQTQRTFQRYLVLFLFFRCCFLFSSCYSTRLSIYLSLVKLITDASKMKTYSSAILIKMYFDIDILSRCKRCLHNEECSRNRKTPA